MGYIGKIVSEHKPIKVSGKEVILIRDYLNTPPSVGDYTQVQERSAKYPAVYVLDEDIAAMRSSYPDIPIYGFWQLISANKLINEAYSLQIAYESGKSGFYVYSDDNGQIVETGEFLDGLFVGSDNVVGMLPADAVQIDVDITKLKLPSVQCYSANEMRKQLSKAKTQKVVIRYSLLAMAALTAFGVNKGLDYHYKTKMEYYNKVDAERRDVYNKYSLLVSEKLTKWPDQSDTIDRLLALTKMAEYTTEIESFSEPKRELYVKEDLPFDPKTLYPWLETYHIPTGGWEISWSSNLEKNSE
ncbi:MAG: hypothetical protein D6B28_11635 [Gammaproteobacteria bacterium]|nr:MAG: hypothetical protein D6B28_11635 [Gammaproteobacteria bacterium]